jgi:hypothetical protein
MDSGKASTRRLRLFLRDFRMLDARVSLAEKQALTSYFGSRKSYVNVLNARWANTDESFDHAVLRVDQVLWASAPDGDVPLVASSLPSSAAKEVEVSAEGGLLVYGGLALGDHQRLSDYLESAGAFIPIHNAKLLRSGRPPREVNVALGDIVLNQTAMQAMRASNARYAPNGMDPDAVAWE